MDSTQYSYLKTAWKAASAALAVLAPGQAAIQSLPDDVDTFNAGWVVYAGAVAIAVIRAAINLYKHREADGNPLKTSLPSGTRGAFYLPTLLAPLLASILLLLPVGCATSVTTKFSETVYDDNGNPATTIYEVKSKGDVEESVHEFQYKYGGEENVIAVGQAAQGITSPAQGDALRALLSLPPDLLRAIVPVGAADKEEPE